MAVTLDALTALIHETLADTLEERGRAAAGAVGPDTALYGEGGLLDSLGVATLVMELEVRLDERHGVAVVLADDKAMSRRSSPFRTFGSLRDYTWERVEKAQSGG